MGVEEPLCNDKKIKFQMVSKSDFKDWKTKMDSYYSGDEFVLLELYCGHVVKVTQNEISIYNISLSHIEDICDEEEFCLTSYMNGLKPVKVFDDYKGFFADCIIEGAVGRSGGENMLIALSNTHYVAIGGENTYISYVELDGTTMNELEFAYTRVSGGDPGSLFAMSDKYVYLFGCASERDLWCEKNNIVYHLLRNKEYEKSYIKKNRLANNFAVIVDLYVTKNLGENRCFGYDHWYIPEEDIPKEDLPTEAQSYVKKGDDEDLFTMGVSKHITLPELARRVNMKPEELLRLALEYKGLA